MKEPNLLHVYAPRLYHDDAYIVGNLFGLLGLQKCIQEAILAKETNYTQSVDMCTSDGEGFYLFVKLEDSSWQDKKWRQLSLPYTDEKVFSNHRDALHPTDLIGIDIYKKLYEIKE